MTVSLSRLGQVRGSAADDFALFLKLGLNEVLEAYQTACVFRDKIYTRTIKGAKSADFPIAGKKSARYHIPGTAILGSGNSPSDLNVRNIALDALMIADDSIYELDELMNFWDVRQNYTQELGRALAYETDRRAARMIFAAAGNSTEPLAKAVSTGRTGFTVTLSAGYAAATAQAKGDELVSAIYRCKANFTKKDVPPNDRWVALGPDDYGALSQSTRVINQDFNGGTGANGTIADGRVMNVAGIKVIESNFVTQPAYTLQAGLDRNPDYAQDLSKCVGLVWRKQCAGMLLLKSPDFQVTNADHNIIYQSITMVARQAIGMGVLRAEEACRIVTP
jgi:hypothetical protein